MSTVAELLPSTEHEVRQLAHLEICHRSRARCKDQIRIAKESGLRKFPLNGFDQNQIWLAIVALAGEIEAWKP